MREFTQQLPVKIFEFHWYFVIKSSLFQNDPPWKWSHRIENLILHRTWRAPRLLKIHGWVYTSITRENFRISLVFWKKVLLFLKWLYLKMLSSDTEFNSASNMTSAKIIKDSWMSLHINYEWKFSNFTGILGKSLAFSKMSLFKNDLLGYRI